MANLSNKLDSDSNGFGILSTLSKMLSAIFAKSIVLSRTLDILSFGCHGSQRRTPSKSSWTFYVHPFEKPNPNYVRCSNEIEREMLLKKRLE